MAFSALDLEVHDVLSIMQKNLECPICLDLMKEPVATKCDHIFCRFCMLKLINKKKKGLAACPMCKHEVTKRSLQESPRFRLLVEGLLKTIHAFELDTGYKFSSSPVRARKAIEAISSEKLMEDGGGIIQSTGYRSRRKRAPTNGQENHGVTLETNSNVKLAKDPFETTPQRSKRCKRSSGKHVYVQFGSESSENDLLEKAGSIGSVGEKDLLQTPHQGPDLATEMCDGKESDTADGLSQRPDAEEMIPSDLAEYEFSERENESSRGIASRAEDFRTTASSLSEQHLQKTRDNTASNSLAQQCEKATSHLENVEESLRHLAKAAKAGVECIAVKDKSPKRRSSRRKSKGGDLHREEREAFKRDIDCLYEKESSSLDAQLQQDMPCAYSRKRAKTGVQRVIEWLSNLDDKMVSLPPPDTDELDLDAVPSIEDGENGESDRNSLASDKTEIMLNPLEVTLPHELGQSSLKPTAVNIEDKIFGKTYKRERKSNPHLNLSILNESKSTDEAIVEPVKECKNSRTNILKRRKKSINLQPEDFIRKANKDQVKLPIVDVHQDIVDGIAERKDPAWATVDFEVSPPNVEAKVNGKLAEMLPVEVKSVCKALNEQVKSSKKITELLSNTHDQMQEANVNSGLTSKQGKSQTRRARALELVSKEKLGKENPAEVVDTISFLNPCNQVDLQIDSYPSSEEPRKPETAPTSFRRSRRLLLQTEETRIQTKPCSDSHVERKEDQISESDILLGEAEMTVPDVICPKSDEHEELNRNKLRSVGSSLENDLYSVNKTLHLAPENCSAQKGERDSHVSRSAESSQWSLSELHNESEEADSQNSTSLLNVTPKNGKITHALQNVHVNEEYSDREVSIDCLPNTLSMDINFQRGNLEHTRSQVPHLTNILPATNVEAEDSELETEYLLKTFKGAKRRSFLLQPSPQNECAAENPVSRTPMDQICQEDDAKGKATLSNCVEDEPLAVTVCTGYPKTNGYSYDSGRRCSTDRTARHSECGNTDCDNLRENNHGSSQNQELCTPLRNRRTARRSKKGLQNNTNPNAIGVSPLEVVESSYRNLFKGSGRSGDLHNTGEIIVEGTDSNTINETELSEGTSRMGRAEVSKSKGLALNVKPGSMPPPLAVTHQSAAAVCFKVAASETRQGENEQVGRDSYQSSAFDKEQVSQIACAGRARGSEVDNFAEQPGAVNGSAMNDTPLLSVTPDGLLCYSNEAKGNTDLSDKDMTNKSGLPKTFEDDRLVESSSSGSAMSGFKRCTQRQPAVKLFSSESSEEEELPCFRALLFGEAFNQSYDSAGQKSSTNEFSAKQQGGGLVLSSNSVCEPQEPKILADLSREGPLSPSQESECSVNLFSSQSNASENSAKGAEARTQSTFSSNQRKSPLGTEEPVPVEMEEVDCAQDHEPAETDFGDEQQDGQSMEHRLGDGSEYGSEASHTGDSGLSSQSEILTTQQRDAMQHNLEKLQKEMAVLEAVLEQNGTQVLDSQTAPRTPPRHDAAGCLNRRGELPEKGTSFTSKSDTEGNEKGVSSVSADNEPNVIPGYPSASEGEELENKGSPTPPSTPSKSQLSKRTTPEKVKLSLSLLKELKESICGQEDISESVSPDQQMPREEIEQSVPEGSESGDQRTGIKQSSGRVLARLYENIGITPNKACPALRRPSIKNSYGHSRDSLVSPCITSKEQRRKPKRGEGETVASTVVSPVRRQDEPVVVKTPVVTTRRKISMVASGLNQSELLLVQKFASKTQSTLSHQITEGTTHVIMKTDADLVCERTLKYFLGIAGRKWVVSHQWIVQCFKEGRILDEVDFEVRGDVINGRNHRGPQRARLAVDGVLWRDFEICCYGSFTDMKTEHLEWMVKLCGGSVVKQPHLFAHEPKSTAVVVVQPDACPEETDFGAIKRKYNVNVVTREWMLDSVACYKCQKFNEYLFPES